MKNDLTFGTLLFSIFAALLMVVLAEATTEPPARQQAAGPTQVALGATARR